MKFIAPGWNLTSGQVGLVHIRFAGPKPARRSGSTTEAFTLIEVLVSLAIFALAAVVLGAAYVNVLTSYASVARRQEHEQEVRLVRTLVVAEPDRTIVEKGGTFNLPDNRAARWSAIVEEGTVADLFRVTLRCEIPETSRPQPWVREESFMLLRPTWSDPAIRDELRQKTRDRLAKRDLP